MTRKNDLTALLPFPAARIDAASNDRDANRTARKSDRSSTRSAPVQLDQLDLADLVRHHARRSAALRGADQDAVFRREGVNNLPHDSRWFEGEGRQAGDVRVEGDAAGSLAARAGNLRAGAVRQENVSFYLDLLGAVTVMALVLLAAILA